MAVQVEHDSYEHRVEGVQQLAEAGVNSAKGGIVKQGANPVQASCDHAAYESEWVDIKVAALKQGHDENKQPGCACCAHGDHSQRRHAGQDGLFSEDGG